VAGLWRYESFSINSKSEAGIETLAAFADVSLPNNRQTRACLRFSRERVGIAPRRRAETSIQSAESELHHNGQYVTFMKCASALQYFMQEFCIPTDFGRRIRPEGARPSHDPGPTVRGVHAELPEHGV
jgi:hypothetical protein